MPLRPALHSAAAVLVALIAGVGELAALQRSRLRDWLQHAR